MSATQEQASPPGDDQARPRARADDLGPPQACRHQSDPVAPTELLKRSLRDAEELLSYAAQTGRFPLEAPGVKESFKQWVIDGVINARVAIDNKRLTKGVVSGFWASFADLSRITRPVTAASLRVSRRDPVRYVITSLLTLLVFSVVLTSVYLFANTSMTTQLAQTIDQQNKAALTLWSHAQSLKGAANGGGDQQGPANAGAPTSGQRANPVRVTPDELFAEVVEFARMNASLRQTAWQYNMYFIPRPFRVDTTPIDFGPDDRDGITRLNVNPEVGGTSEIIAEASYQIRAYQRIRDFAEAAYKGNLILWNGITAYLLPAVYALLGAGLYGLRVYVDMVRQQRYVRSPASGARYLIAFIAGSVIGLFGSLLPQNPSVPPLAIAFLVGYAVEAFLSRLDGFMEKVKGEGAARAPPMEAPVSVPSTRDKAANE